MAITSAPVTQVVVRFTVTDGDHTYTDALYLTPEEHAALTPEQLTALQQARFDAWLAVVTAPPRVPTEAEQQEQLDALVEQQKAAQVQLAALASADALLPILQDQAVVLDAQITSLQSQAAPLDPAVDNPTPLPPTAAADPTLQVLQDQVTALTAQVAELKLKLPK